MHTSTIPALTLLILLLQTTSTLSFVLFPHPPSASPSSPILLIPSPTDSATNPDLKPRQAQITAPAAAQPVDPNQISPITTYQADSRPPGGGAAVRVPVVYTQTFAAVPDQWEVAGVGSVGMGTIVGEIGVVKSKRFVPFVVEVTPETEVGGGEEVKTVSFTA